MIIFESEKLSHEPMFYGLDVVYKNNLVDSFDPIISISKDDKSLQLNNGFYIYNIKLSEIKSLILYERHILDNHINDKNHKELNITEGS